MHLRWLCQIGNGPLQIIGDRLPAITDSTKQPAEKHK
jgi:hypothetical protein